MYKESFHGVTNWVAGTGASVCLALFIFAPTITAEHEDFKVIAVSLVLASLPLFVATCIKTKDIKFMNKENQFADNQLGKLFVPAIISFGAGFILLCFSVKIIYGFIIILSAFLAAYLIK